MTLYMRDKANYEAGFEAGFKIELEKGRLMEIFASVQEGDYSAQRGAQKANMTLPEFEAVMEKAKNKPYKAFNRF